MGWGKGPCLTKQSMLHRGASRLSSISTGCLAGALDPLNAWQAGSQSQPTAPLPSSHYCKIALVSRSCRRPPRAAPRGEGDTPRSLLPGPAP